MICAHCKGTATSKVSVVYKSGASTTHSEGRSHGMGAAIGTGGIGLGIGVSSNEGYSQTRSILAAEVAPPAEPPGVIGIIFFGLLASLLLVLMSLIFRILALSAIISLLGLIATAYLVRMRIVEMVPAYKKNVAEWNARWICLQCSHQWTPDE